MSDCTRLRSRKLKPAGVVVEPTPEAKRKEADAIWERIKYRMVQELSADDIKQGNIKKLITITMEETLKTVLVHPDKIKIPIETSHPSSGAYPVGTLYAIEAGEAEAGIWCVTESDTINGAGTTPAP